MRSHLLQFQVLALCLTLALFLGATQIGGAVAGSFPPDDDCLGAGASDSCCEGESPDQTPCTGAADDCDCPCCPLPVMGEAFFPIHIASLPVSVTLSSGQTPASAIAPSLDHPPE